MAKRRNMSAVTPNQAAKIRQRIHSLVKKGVPHKLAYDSQMGSGSYEQLTAEIFKALEQAKRF